MKKYIVSVFCIACMLPALVCTAFANEGYAIHPKQSLPESILGLLSGNTSVALLDHDPTRGTVSYVSWVSYDYLSELSTHWQTAGVIVYNTTMNAYFIRVSFIPTISTSGDYEYCALGTTNGFVLGAEADKTSDALDQILAALGGNNGGISYFLNRIEYYLTWSLEKKLSALQTSSASLDTKASQIVTSLDSIIQQLSTSSGYLSSLDASLSSVISGGKLLVDNSDVVDAIENITIPAPDNTGIIAALGRIETQLGDLNVNMGDLNITGSEFDDTDIIKAIQSIPAYDDGVIRSYLSSLESSLRGIYNDTTFIKSHASNISDDVNKTYYLLLDDFYPSLMNCEASLYEMSKHVEVLENYRPYDDKALRDLISATNSSLGAITVLSGDISTFVESSAVSAFAIDARVFSLLEVVTSMAEDVSNGVGYLQALHDLYVPFEPSASVVDLAPVITSVDAVGVNIEDLNANFNTNIGSLLDKLDIVIEGSSESLENRINVTIDASNDAHNVFYVTGEDGEEQSVTEFTGDLTKASGRLLSLLYRLVFADALSTVDGDLDGFEDFFTSQGDDTSTQSMDSPYEESENVWLVS